MEPVSKLYPEYRSSASPTAPMNERELDSEPAVSSPPGITAASLITTKQLMSQKISGDDTYDVITSSPSSSSDGSSNEFVKVEHSDVQRSAGLTDNTLPFGMLQLHNDENDKRKDDRKNFENIMDHGFESEEQYSRILPRAEEFAESAFEKMSDVAQAGVGKVMDVSSRIVDDATKIKGEVSGDTINLFSDKMKETAEQTRDMGHQAMETVKDTASDMLSGAVHGISNLSEKVHNVGADITHSLDEAYDAGSHSAFHQPMHDVQQNADDPSQQWGMDWRQYADEAANIDVRHSDLETDVKAVQSTGSTIRDEIINAHDQVDSLIANMFTSSTPQHHDDSSAEESMFDRKGPLTIPHQIPEDMIQLDRDFDSPKQGGFEVSPRPPTPPKELDDEDVKPTTIDLGQTGGRLFVAGEHPSSILKHNPQVPRFNFKNIDARLLDVIYWRDPKKSGAILLVTLSALLILANFPLIAIFSYVGLSILGGTLGFRIYKLVEAQIKKTDGRNPYGSYLNQEFHLPKEKVHQQVDALIEHVQFIVNKLRRLFLVESIMDSVKFGLLLWALTYVSCWFSGLSLLILALLAVFTIPKVYEVYQEPIDRNMSIAKQHVGNVNTIIGEKIPFLKKSADSHEKSN